MDDSEILALLHGERLRARGSDDDIVEDRDRALDYISGRADSGYLRRDLPPAPGLSSVVSSDVHDAVETILPDLMEIFTSGDDIVSFQPQSEDDEDAARQETDYLNYVFYRQNDGWMTIYTAIKDALVSKLGVIKWWWESSDDVDEFSFEDKTPEEMTILRRMMSDQDIEIITPPDIVDGLELPVDGVTVNPVTGLSSFRARRRRIRSRARVAAVAPEDFFADRHASSMRDAMWAAHRTRIRAYELIDQGFDPDLVDSLHAWTEPSGSGASEERHGGVAETSASGADGVMRMVEIVEYNAWIDADGDGDVRCWRVVTGNDDSVMLDRVEIAGMQFATLCPFPETHQLYGRSLADLLVEVQRVKTALTRMMLNHAYFSVNPRQYVDMNQVHQYTLSDLAENRPGRPVRGIGPSAVTSLPVPQLGFDIFGALEYMSVVGEGRTGVVRNAQGLNPDTLHDTARGMTELMAAAQRKTRMIARVFAETGIRDLFIGLHDLIVRHAREADTVRLTGREFVSVDPSKWGRRKDLTVEVGLGSNTRLAEFQFWQTVIGMQAQAAPQGLADGRNFFNAVKRLMKAGGVRNPEQYFRDPVEDDGASAQPQQPPSADIIRVNGELELKKQQAAADQEMAVRRFEFEARLALFKAQAESGLAERAAQTEAQLEATIAGKKLEIDAFKAISDSQVKSVQSALSARTKLQQADNSISNVRLGGTLG